ENRMPQLGSNLYQRLQHEAATVHFRMGHRQFLTVNHRVPKQQDVNVDLPRRSLPRAPASHVTLNGQQRSNQLFRHFLGFQSDGAVQVPGMSGDFDGLGFVESGLRDHLSQRVNTFDRRLQMDGSI